MREFLRAVSKDKTLTEEELKQLALKRFSESQHHSRAWYRIQATRQFTGGHKLDVLLNERLKEKYNELREGGGDTGNESRVSLRKELELSENSQFSVIEFSSSSVAVLERDQRARLGIRRYGNTKSRVIVRIETVDGTATKNEDYIPVKRTLVFEEDQTFQHLDIEIIDDNDWEPDETFFVKLHMEPGQKFSKLGPKPICQITIINDDEPGTFEFEAASFLFKESCGQAFLNVKRVNGADGNASVKWHTENMTAKAGIDFEAGSGELQFQHGEIEKSIEILIVNNQEKEKDDHFKVILSECSKGAKLGNTSTTIVTIVNDDDYNNLVSRLADAANLDLDTIRVDKGTYADQFRQALNVNGGDLDTATAVDYVLHFMTFGWKLVFALVPPPSIWGGWLCFLVSLLMIAIVTTIIGDLASIFGCLVNLKDSVTAITFVALGTSLPDLFASRQAALMDPSADNAVGNVTGSNSVNVFLGLGISWLVASSYWFSQGKMFKVPAGDLAFSVILYTTFSILAIALLIVRRFMKPFGKGELGGPKVAKYLSGGFLIFLWVLYVLLSALQNYEYIAISL